MICPKCESTSLYQDNDDINDMYVIACLMCGYRKYEVKEEKAIRRDSSIEQQCQMCGEFFESGIKAKYCPACKKKRKRGKK